MAPSRALSNLLVFRSLLRHSRSVQSHSSFRPMILPDRSCTIGVSILDASASPPPVASTAHRPPVAAGILLEDRTAAGPVGFRSHSPAVDSVGQSASPDLLSSALSCDPQRLVTRSYFRFFTSSVTEFSKPSTAPFRDSLIRSSSNYSSSESSWRYRGGLLSGAFGLFLGLESFRDHLESEPILTEATHQSDQLLLPSLVATRLAESFLEELRRVCDRERIVTDLDDRNAHGKPWNTYHKLKNVPDLVIYPKTTEEIVTIVKLCDKYKVPVTPYGAATSLEGHTLTPHGGVSLDMTLMKGVKALHLDDMDVVVEPGIGWIELNEYLKPYGLFFPLDPGPGATIGGMCATRCSGSLAVRYGTMRDNVISLKAVMANGDVVKTASRARKSAAGYDLTRLLIGSEGTLAVITEVTLRLQKIPQASTVAMCNFPSIGDAADVAIAIMHSGIQASRIELLDNVMIKAVNLANGTTYPEEPTLMFELIGTEAYALEQTQLVQSIAEKHHASDFVYAKTPEEKVELWKIRKEAFWATATLSENAEAMVTDVCVPLSKLAECIATAKLQLDASPLVTCILSHAGDGNFHAIILFNPDDKGEVDEAQRLSNMMVHTALALEGTCTGEHGIGVGKMKYLEEELGQEAVKSMGAIKRALDPHNIMNPGKIIPPQFCY
ncbi:unnamed protein product [Calypogeia fissa]